MSIRLSKEHGVNPTIGVCYFCHCETGELALLGYNKGKEADKYTILSKEPCDSCKDAMKQGICIYPVKEVGGHPLGGMVCLTEDAVRGMVKGDPDVMKAALEKRALFVPEYIFQKIVDVNKES